MLLQSSRAVLLLCATAGFLGWLGLAVPPEKVGTPPPELGFPQKIPLNKTTGDSRFQDEATPWEMSHLDSCHCLVAVGFPSDGKLGFLGSPTPGRRFAWCGDGFWGGESQILGRVHTFVFIFYIPKPTPLSPHPVLGAPRVAEGSFWGAQGGETNIPPSSPPKYSPQEEPWEAWMRSALGETPVAQLLQDIAHRMGTSQGWDAATFPNPTVGLIQPPHRERERPWGCRAPGRTPGCPIRPPPGAGRNSGCSPPTRWEHSKPHSRIFSHPGASSPLLCPSFPRPERILLLREVMEKLWKLNQSLELMLTALGDARIRLEKHLEHLKATPDPEGEREWALGDRWEPVGANTGLFFLTPQVRAQVPPPPASHTCSWFSSSSPRHSEPSSSSSSSSSLPAPSASRQSPLSCSWLWQVGTSVGTAGWGHSTLGVLCALPPSPFPSGHWLMASPCPGAGRIQPVVPREEPRFRLTSTPER